MVEEENKEKNLTEEILDTLKKNKKKLIVIFLAGLIASALIFYLLTPKQMLIKIYKDGEVVENMYLPNEEGTFNYVVSELFLNQHPEWLNESGYCECLDGCEGECPNFKCTTFSCEDYVVDIENGNNK